MSKWRPWQRIIVGIVALVVLAAILLPALTGTRPRSSVHCIFNMKQLSHGLLQYAADNQEVLPTRDWVTAALPYTETPNVSRCPELREGSGYAMNGNLLGKRLPVGDDLGLTFETNDLALGATAKTLLPLDPPRHEERQMVGYVDGHVKPTPFADLAKVKLQLGGP